MASNAGSEEARTERLRRKREADRPRRPRETAAERDTRFLHNLVLTIKQTLQIGCMHSLDWTTGLTYFWFLCMLWLF